MSAPYWGQLPPPKVTRTDSMKRTGNLNQQDNLTINTNTKGDRMSGQSYSRRNRDSTQTEAQTVSTQSPFASPTASSFQGDGLAPRPSSYQPMVADTYNKDYLEKRRRREARNNEVYDDNPPPAAPDVPRAPPLSYKQPYGNGPTRSRSTSRTDGPSIPQQAQRVPDNYQQTEKRDPVRRSSKGKEAVRAPARRDSEPQARKGSISEAEAQRRREWAPDRSPLQRLELTLDSITKEEKRARVEEAELLAREAKAGNGDANTGERSQQNSVRFRNRPVAKGPDPSLAEPLPTSAPERKASITQTDELERSATTKKKRPITVSSVAHDTVRGFDYQPKEDEEAPIQSQKFSGSERNPTHRDKAVPVAVGAVAAAGLARSGSNKLKKDPPGDPWFNRRQDAEKQYQDVIPRKQTVTNRQISAAASRDKELPSLPKEARAPAYPINTLALDSDNDEDLIPVRRGSTKKIQQLTGEPIVPQTARAVAPSQLYGERTNLGRSGSQREPVNDLRADTSAVNGSHYAAVPGNLNGQTTTHQEQQSHHRLSNILHLGKHDSVSGQGVYVPSRRLDEWKKGGVVLLDGTNLDLDAPEQTDAEKDRAWWEAGNTGRRRRSSTTTKQRKAEAYDSEFDEATGPTRFKPPLFLKAGPFLRYCGLRRERKQGRIPRDAPRPEREIWRGSVMIVTQDSNSSYELAPTLRLFLQPMDLLPPPPAEVDGPVAPEYVDPIAGLPKIGRDGRTLYIRPVEHLEEAKDLSREESDEGLFETLRSNLDGTDTKPNPQKPVYDGEKVGKYKEIRGFRLHAEHGVTFWKFNLEIELRDNQQRIAYRINRGPATGFWVPAKNEAMNIMFYSCNGFSHGVDPNNFSGPDPLWRDVLNTHQTQPFHVMLGGGDQLYNDAVQYETTIFKEWTQIRDHHHKEEQPFTPELQDELEKFYLTRYAMWFSQGLFGLAISQIPMINIFDDHDIIDGFGSYSDRYMRCPVMSGLGAIAFKYYMLFQHQSSIDEGEETEPSWVLGAQPGPYIPELSRSIFTFLGRQIAFLGLDCRTERMYDEVVSPETYDKVLARLEKDIIKGETKHLIVLLGVPIAYPRMVWLENILTSRLMDPVKALSRAGLLGKNLLNHLDGGVEILDDLDDHWTAKHHKDERNFLIEELQELAAEKSVRITFLGGDVHLAAIGQFYSNPKLGIPKDRDHRYMPNIVSSAIANTPPPDALADLLNKRNKIHHLDDKTDEDMIPIFSHDVTGKPRNNKRLLNRRNWCAIRVYNPDLSPPPTPASSNHTLTNTNTAIATPPVTRSRSLLRRFSTSKPKSPTYRQDAGPPLSSTSFFNRQSQAQSQSQEQGQPQPSSRRGSTSSQRPSLITRTLSLTRKDFNPSSLFRRSSTSGPRRRRRDDGINGYNSSTDSETEPEEVQRTGYSNSSPRRSKPAPNSNARTRGPAQYQDEDDSTEDEAQYARRQPVRSGIRGGGADSPGVDSDGYFPGTSTYPTHNNSRAVANQKRSSSISGDADFNADPNPNARSGQDMNVPPPRRAFHRTPTSLSSKQAPHTVNLEGGLDITLNVEVSPRDPAGITMPYRLLVPRLWYVGQGDEVKNMRGGMRRWAGFVRGGRGRWRDHHQVEEVESGGDGGGRSGGEAEVEGGGRRWSGGVRGL